MPPVVATKNGGPGEFVTHDVTGYSVNDNADSIAWGIGHGSKVDFDDVLPMGGLRGARIRPNRCGRTRRRSARTR